MARQARDNQLRAFGDMLLDNLMGGNDQRHDDLRQKTRETVRAVQKRPASFILWLSQQGHIPSVEQPDDTTPESSGPRRRY